MKLIVDWELGCRLSRYIDSILEKIDPKEYYSHTKYGDIIKYAEAGCYKVATRRLEDRTHVYCEIDFDRIDNLEKIICRKIHEAKVRGRL